MYLYQRIKCTNIIFDKRYYIIKNFKNNKKDVKNMCIYKYNIILLNAVTEFWTKPRTEEELKIAEIIFRFIDFALAMLILYGLVLLIKKMIKKIKQNKQDKIFEAKKKKYESFNHNSGEAWDYESARAYSNEGQEFKQDYNNSYEQKNNYENIKSSNSDNNYFESLFADAETIEQATSVYKNLSKVFHPDSQNGSEEKMKALTAAYENYKKTHK